MDDALVRAREALTKCRAQFEFYVQSHLAKQPPDMDKAATNQKFVEMLDAALAQPAPVDVGVAERAAKWLRECHDWLLSNDLDGGCPMGEDPLDIAEDLERVATLSPDVAAERERCLQIIDDRMPRNDPSDWTEWAKTRAEVLTDLAAAIRGGAE